MSSPVAVDSVLSLFLSLCECTRFYKLCLNPKSEGFFYGKRRWDLFLSLCEFFLH